MNPKKSVVLVNRYYDPDQSATSQMLSDLAKGLAERGHDVHVIACRQLYDDPTAYLPQQEIRAGVHIRRIGTTRFGRNRLLGRVLDYLSFYVVCAGLLLALLRRGDVLVVKTDPPLLSIIAAPIAKAKGVALITWQQDVFPEVASHLGANPLPTWLDRGLKRLRDTSLHVATMNVLIGDRMREYLLGRGIPESKLCVIENWADDLGIRPKPVGASALRTSLDKADGFVVCYSGNLGRAHEFETLLGAAEALKGADFLFLIIGGGAKIQALKRGVSDRSLDNFRFLPYQSRDSLEDSLAAGDVHLVSLLPTLEGLIVPSKLYGILAAGRAVIFIGDPDGEVARIVERAHCGRQVGVGDSASLAALLLNLKATPEVLEQMGLSARQLLSERFGRQRALDRWHDLVSRTTHT